MKESSSPKSPASLFITIGVVLVHVIIIGAIVWGCSSRSGKKGGNDGGKDAAATTEADDIAPANRHYRVPSANPNFGKPLDFGTADRRSPDNFLPGLTEWKGTGIIVDMDNHKVLWEKDAQKPVPVASMVKMMTALLVAEELERNPNLSLDTEITITDSARGAIRDRGAKLMPELDVGRKITVGDLLRCVLVCSANDAANQLAEVVAGNVDKFIEVMNNRARELGLNPRTKFYTANGLNDIRGKEILTSVASAADMVTIAERLLEYPFVLEMTSSKAARIDISGQKVTIRTTNILLDPSIAKKQLRGLKPIPGVDGMKTGYIERSGACLTFSVLRNGRRMIGCVTNFRGHPNRYNFCRRLIDWAYDPASLKKVPSKPQPAKPGVKKTGKATKAAPKKTGKATKSDGKNQKKK